MEMVIERGKARCPFCVAVADYRFIERERDLVRYEVHCDGCGQRYREKLGVAAPNLPVLVDDWVPVERQPGVPLSERLRAGMAAARARSLALSGSAAGAWQGLRARRRDAAPAESVV
ncbi:hypothetical protein ACWDUN_13820 [Mycobacterium sp. NPDC003323]